MSTVGMFNCIIELEQLLHCPPSRAHESEDKNSFTHPGHVVARDLPPLTTPIKQE